MTIIASSEEIDRIFNSLPKGEFETAYDIIDRDGKAYFIASGGGYHLTKNNLFDEPNLIVVLRWWKKRGEK
jgi:hypothetical protein